MATELTAILSADSSQLLKSLNDAKNTLKKYKDETGRTTSVTNAQITSFNKSVNSLNKLTNSAKTNAQLMNGLKKQLIELSTQYKSLDENARKSDFGKALENTIRETENRYKELKRTVDDVNKSIGETAKQAGSVKDVLNKISTKTLGVDFASFTKVGATVGAVGLIANEFKRSADMAVQFEDALSNLSAITGMQGKELEALKQLIIDTGNETSKSFTAIADAYTKVGSKMPELLKQPKALDEVTRAVITLSKAARMTVDESTDALLGIMNQMGASASEAATYINVLAAGSKNGAGDIKYLAEAFTQCGTASATAKLSIQQATALIEVLAQKIPNASTAGTNLRNILLKLSTDTDSSINPTVVGLTTALENLAKKADDTAYMTKKFGKENVSAAITLAKSADKADELTKAVTGTNEAEQQAKTQTDNVAGAVKKLTLDWDNFITELNNSTGVLKTVIGLLDKVILGWKNALSAKSAYENNKTSGGKGANDAQGLINNTKAGAKGDTAKDKLKDYLSKMRSNIKFYEDERRKTLDQITAKTPEQLRKELSALAARYEGTINTLKAALASAKETDFETVATITPTPTDTPTTTKNKGGSSNNNKVDPITKVKEDLTKQIEKQYWKNIHDAKYEEIELPLPKIKETDSIYNDDGTFKNKLQETLKDFQDINLEDPFKDWSAEDVEAYNNAVARTKAQLEGLSDIEKALVAIDSLGSAFNLLGAAIGGVGGSWVSFVGTFAQGVSQMLPLFAALIGANQAAATAEGVTSGAALPFPANLVAIASIVGTVASIFASLPTFADGGVLKGATSIGDLNVARVNGGEMILNGTLQQKLFNLLNGSGGYAGNVSGGDVEFKISGNNLVGVLNNYNKKHSRL